MRRSVGIVAIFVVSFAIWIALFAAAGTFGIPARQLLENSCHRDGFQVARIAFQTEDVEKVDYVLSGTADFVESVSSLLPQSAGIVQVPLRRVSLRQFGQVVETFKPKSPTLFILQNAPHLWIDIDHRLARGNQNTLTWKLYNTELTMTDSLMLAKESFKSLGEIITKRCEGKSAGGDLPSSFLWTSFLPEPLMSRRRNEFRPNVKIGKGREGTRIVWVFDPGWIPEDAMDDTRRALIEFATGPRKVDRLGEIVSLGALPEYLQQDSD